MPESWRARLPYHYAAVILSKAATLGGRHRGSGGRSGRINQVVTMVQEAKDALEGRLLAQTRSMGETNGVPESINGRKFEAGLARRLGPNADSQTRLPSNPSAAHPRVARPSSGTGDAVQSS